MTDAERLLWRHLRAYRLVGEKFRRQQPVGRYVVDFFHPSARLIIEVDGGQHNESETDAKRDAWFRERDYTVLRFWNNDVLTNTESVLEVIAARVEAIPLSAVPSVRSRLPVSRELSASLHVTSRGEGGTADGGRDSVDTATCAERKTRPIRSYVLRQGRITDAQRRALDTLWPRYGVTLGDAPLDLAALFGRIAPVVLEIGFGNGDALAAFAIQHPEQNFLGVEVHRPGVGSLLRKVADGNLENVRVIVADANEVVARLAPASLSGVHLFFPDPWPKKRHHKR